MSEPEQSPPTRPRLGILAIIGPGLLIAATGVGAGDLATASFAGSKLGPAILWAVVLGAFLKFVLNEGLTRWQLATGQTLLEGAIHRLGKTVTWIFLPYLLLWSFFVGSALMSACGVATHAMIPVFDDPDQGKLVFGIACSVLGVVLVRLGGFKLFEKIMSACIVVMFFTVLATALLLKPDWGAIVKGLTVPQVPHADGKGLGWTIALMGGVGGTLTVLCYGYWIREKGRTSIDALKTCRIDLGVGYFFTAIFGIAMVVIASRITVEGSGASLIVKLADQLEQPLGKVGRWAFLIGAWGALFSSLLGVWQAVPYLFADFVQMRRQLLAGGEVKPAPVDTNGPLYRIYLAMIAGIPMVALLPDVQFKEIQKIYSIIGAWFMPLLALLLLIMNGRKAWIGQWRNRPITIAILTATLIFFAYAGYLHALKKLAG